MLRKIGIWILIGLGVILIGIGIYTYIYYFHWMYMSPSLVQKTEAVLTKGITVNDSQNDFIIMETNKEVPNENNPSPYRVPYLDIKNVQLGADNEYLYIKITFQDTLPKKPGNIDGDYFHSIGVKLSLMDKQGVEQVIWHLDAGWIAKIHLSGKSTFYSWGPTGIEWPEDARFLYRGNDSKVGGGVGFNYILGVLPLKNTGLKLGDITYFGVSEETESDKYTHAAVDVLLGEGKMPAFIEWSVGSDYYKILEQSLQNGN